MSAALSQNKRAAAAVAAMGLVWAALAAVVLAMPFGNILGFLAFQLFAVALPGIAIVKLSGLDFTPLEAFTLSYALGLAVNIAIYFCFAPFSCTAPVKYCVGAVAAASLAVLYVKRKTPFSRREDTGELSLALVVSLAVMLITFVSLSAGNLNPALSGARSYFHDILNAVGITASASRGFPFEFLQMTGTPYYYHAFYFAYSAVLKLTLNMPAFEVVTKLTLITISPFLASSATVLARRILKSNAALRISVFFAAVLPAGYTMYFYEYSDTLGFPLGAAFALLSLTMFFYSCERSPRRFDGFFALSLALMTLSLGAKGPVTVTYVFGICFVLLVQILRDRNYSAFAKGAAIAGTFFSIYLLLYRTGAGDSMSWRAGYSALNTDFGHWALDSLPAPLAVIISCVKYSLEYLPVVPLSLAACIILLARRDKLKNELWFCVAAFSFGLTIINLFKQMGSSEVYFLTGVFQVAVIFLAYFGERAYSLLAAKRRRTALAALAASIALCLYAGMKHSYSYIASDLSAAVRFSRFSDMKIVTDEQYEQLDADGKRRSAVTPEEYEAYVWIRDNTPFDAVFADSRYMAHNKYFGGTAFSERGFYLEGTGYVTMEGTNSNTPEYLRRNAVLQYFFEDEDETFIPLLKREGVDYIIISQYITPGFILSGEYADEVFSNAHTAVYKFK